MDKKAEAMDTEEETASQRCGSKRKSTTLPSCAKREPKTRAQWKPNLFQKDWLKQDLYKGWLAPVEDDNYQAKCVACNMQFICGNEEVKSHANEDNHKEKVDIFYSSYDIPFGVKDSEEVDRLWKHKDQVQTAENMLARHMVKLEFDPCAANCFINLTKEIAYDSAIAADLSVERCMALYNSLRPNL